MGPDKTKEDNLTRNVFILLVVCLVVLSLPTFLKVVTSGEGLTSSESYMHMKLIETYNFQDSTHGPWSLYHVAMHFLAGSSSYAVLLIQIVLGVVSFYLFFKLLQKIGIGDSTMIFSLLILVSSPVFIYSFTTITPEAFILPLFLGAVYLFNEKNYWFMLLSFLLVLVNVPSAIVLLVLLLIHYTVDKKYYGSPFFASVVTVCVSFGVVLFVFGQRQLLQFVPKLSPVSSVFVTMGAEKGYSFIIIVLALIGTYYFWRKEIARIVLYSSLILLGTISYFFTETRVLVMLAIALFAGSAVSMMVTRKWYIDVIKDVTLLLVVCSILFASVIFVKGEIVSVEDPKVDAAKFLTATGEYDIILSSISNGYLIKYFSDRQVFIDESSYMYGDYEYRKEIADKIFYSRNLGEVESWLNAYNITHIFVDEEMTQGEIWNSPDEGVLFLLQNSRKFAKIFDNGAVQIYMYNRD